MCFILNEIVVCSCNMLFDFFVRYTILSGNTMWAYKLWYRYYLNVLIFFIIKINKYISMLWSLRIIDILFAEIFKVKTVA